MSKWILALCCWFASPLSGQVGKETGYWEFIKEDPKAKSICTVWCDEGVAGGFVAECDGDRFLLTAAHVVMRMDSNHHLLPDPVANIKVCFRGGKVENATVHGFDLDADVCWLDCVIPDEIPALPIAREPVKAGDTIEIIGLGGLTQKSAPIRHWKAVCTTATRDGELVADCCLIPGDSGGAILHNGEVVGIVSGGWTWLNERGFTEDGRPISVTWPCRGCNVKFIREVLGK